MSQWLSLFHSSDQTARPTATTLSAAAADIFTSEDFFEPRRITKLGFRFTTAFGVTPTTAAKLQIKTLDKDDSTVAVKAALTLNATSQAVGDIVYSDLKRDGNDFLITPGQRLRVSVATAATMPGGSASGAGIPMYVYEEESRNPIESTYAWVARNPSTAS